MLNSHVSFHRGHSSTKKLVFQRMEDRYIRRRRLSDCRRPNLANFSPKTMCYSLPVTQLTSQCSKSSILALLLLLIQLQKHGSESCLKIYWRVWRGGILHKENMWQYLAYLTNRNYPFTSTCDRNAFNCLHPLSGSTNPLVSFWKGRIMV